MKWGVKQRQEFIDYRLFWEGSINRKDLSHAFGVSVPQASADIKLYKQHAPGNIYYDKSLRQYLVTSKFNPIFNQINAHAYLSKLSMLSDGIINENEMMMGYIPEYSVVPSIDRVIEPNILKKIIKALKNKKSINIQYQSMRRPSPIWRWITPHAFAFDGFRWHVRAFCELTKEFRDFIIGRIINTQNVKEAKVEASDDFRWNHFVTIKIAAHPDLTSDQQKIIEKEYSMKNGMANIKVRAAFIYYMLLRFNLEIPEDPRFLKNRNAVLLNYKEIEEFI